MSDLLIKGMEMPKNCAFCYFKYVAFEGLVKCDLAGHDFKDYRETGYRDDCPLVPVPPHGRLIDADALAEEHRVRAYQGMTENSYSFHTNARAWVNEAPTILPADKE